MSLAAAGRATKEKEWSHQDSNLDLEFRKLLFYPLNYGTKNNKFITLIGFFQSFHSGLSNVRNDLPKIINVNDNDCVLPS